jgi:hypothetical protein
VENICSAGRGEVVGVVAMVGMVTIVSMDEMVR